MTGRRGRVKGERGQGEATRRNEACDGRRWTRRRLRETSVGGAGYPLGSMVLDSGKHLIKGQLKVRPSPWGIMEYQMDASDLTGYDLMTHDRCNSIRSDLMNLCKERAKNSSELSLFNAFIQLSLDNELNYKQRMNWWVLLSSWRVRLIDTSATIVAHFP